MPAADVLAHYDAAAARTVAAQRSVSFADVHSRLSRHLPGVPASVLDVGSGSGRDAMALADLGHPVVGVEPSAAMRAAALEADPSGSVVWCDDRLPDLDGVRSSGQLFDVVLCSAVLMHVAPAELGGSFVALAAVLAAGGVVAATVREPRSDDPPGLYHPHGADEVEAAAAAAGLVVVDRWRELDAMREDRWWDGWVLARPGDRRPS